MTLLLAVTATGTPEVARPAPERLIAGDPVSSDMADEKKRPDGLYAGRLGNSTARHMGVAYDE